MSITPHNYGRPQGWDESDLTSRDRAANRYPDTLTLAPRPMPAGRHAAATVTPIRSLSIAPMPTPHSKAWHNRRTLARAVTYVALSVFIVAAAYASILGFLALCS